jgi:hypothetical protein
MTRLGKASALNTHPARDYAIPMLINGELTDFDFSARVCAESSNLSPIEAARRRLSDRSAGWGCGARVSARRIPCEDSAYDPAAAG